MGIRVGNIVILLLLVLAGCEKDEKLLIGKWNMTYSNLVNYYKNEQVSDSVYFYESDKNILEFLADGTAKIYRYNDLVGTYNWETKGKWLIINYYTDPTLGASGSRYEYSVDDVILNLKSEGVTKVHDNNYRFVMIDFYSRE